MKIIPPQAELTRIVYETKPRCEISIHRVDLLIHIFALNPTDFAHLTGIWLQVDIFLQKKNVVDFVLAIHSIALIQVMDSREIMKILWPNLTSGYAQFKIESSLRSFFDAKCIQLFSLVVQVIERMRAARVCVAIRKRNLMARPLLHEHLALLVKEENAESSVQLDVLVLIYFVAISL